MVAAAVNVPHIAQVFKALGDQHRVRIFHLILNSDTPLCVCEIVDALELPQYQISRHLAVLKRSGLVSVERRGTWVYYSSASGGFSAELWAAVSQMFRDTEGLDSDMRRLEDRLLLRDGKLCVVGMQEPCDCP
ncbi:MAG: ArsR/SmtB family transcription factor [Spirochaeta sp.]